VTHTQWSLDFKAGVALIAIVSALALVSIFFTPYDYNAMNAAQRFNAPSLAHLMGTDSFGRDVFSRVIIGGRYTLLVSFLTVLGSASIGATLGLLAGYTGKILDEIIMRLMDALSSFPGILLALVMTSLLRRADDSTAALIIALLIMFIPSYARIMRTGALQYRGADFVKVSSIMGASRLHIIFIHILPNLAPSLLAATVLGLSNAILAEATMSYLGLGIQPPLPSWGRMLSESQAFLFNAPWCALSPGFMIMLTVIGFHYIGEGIRQRYC
jgi:peptide/nickel transport system permease protein